ncbi:GAF and ANTAR domain-containing protein [Lentzea albidocapillata]|uniref:GAF domain-containing protein n=1 Tax=Lentzea albidocapillata TaxID=40571 RepID=A0A1W1ZZV2_9PSEU|nr:GAF and ANTAR domain-containing protein [Lentzea albidocapillata]SMC53598.1 GAF domain-containing protein [Lentzea albidocapillata]
METSSHVDRPLPVVLDEVTTALERLSEALSREDDLRMLMHQVCEQVVQAVPGLDEATVTLLDGGRPFTAASTSDLVARLDRVQYAAGAGPCLDAAATSRLVRATIQEAQDRWPAFGTESRAAGIGSFLSAPLTVDNEHYGAINGYSRQGHGFHELDAPLLALYSTAVETALRSHSMYLRAFKLAAQLRSALRSRAVIDQAKGVLMAVHAITADEAFRLLVAQSQRENVKLHALAERFIADLIASPSPTEAGSGEAV